MMGGSSVYIILTISLLCPLWVHAQLPSTTPAPAPALELANLTHLLQFAGPFTEFLRLLRSSQLLDSLQNQVNTSKSGLTIFAPTDAAFSSLKKGTIDDLKDTQLKQLLSLHILPNYESLADFKNLSSLSPTPTLAGGKPFALTFAESSGVIHVSTEKDDARLSSSVWTTPPLALYSVDKVLLPKAIFGDSDVFAPSPSPAPASTVTPDADSPTGRTERADSPGSTDTPSSSPPLLGHTQLVVLVATSMMASFI